MNIRDACMVWVLPPPSPRQTFHWVAFDCIFPPAPPPPLDLILHVMSCKIWARHYHLHHHNHHHYDYDHHIHDHHHHPPDLIFHKMSCKIWARHYHHHHHHYHPRHHHSSWSQSSPLWIWSPHSWSSPPSAWSYLTCDVLQDRGSPQSLAATNPDKREQLHQISKQTCCLQIFSR